MRTQLILLERVKNLGKVGDHCWAKRGYAHFLLREGKALRMNEHNKALFEKQKAELDATNKALYSKAEKQAAQLEKMFLHFVRPAGNSGQLYGSILPKDIQKLLQEKGFEDIKVSMISLPKSVKTVGVHGFQLQLHPDFELPMLMAVAKTAGEASKLEADYKNPPAEKLEKREGVSASAQGDMKSEPDESKDHDGKTNPTDAMHHAKPEDSVEKAEATSGPVASDQPSSTETK